MRIPGRLRLIAVTIALGCSTSETTSDVSRDSASPSATAIEPAPWYRSTRVLDLTGDGRPDSVRLDAMGARPDSLDISLVLIVDGREAHQERWGSSYELTMLDSAARTRVDGVLRARLDSVLESVTVQRLDAPGVRLMAEDMAVLAGIDPRPAQRVSFSYGYESTTRLVWHASRERFVRLWSCC